MQVQLFGKGQINPQKILVQSRAQWVVWSFQVDTKKDV